jgi:hypothetical protein
MMRQTSPGMFWIAEGVCRPRRIPENPYSSRGLDGRRSASLASSRHASAMAIKDLRCSPDMVRAIRSHSVAYFS